MEIPRKITAT